MTAYLTAPLAFGLGLWEDDEDDRAPPKITEDILNDYTQRASSTYINHFMRSDTLQHLHFVSAFRSLDTRKGVNGYSLNLN